MPRDNRENRRDGQALYELCGRLYPLCRSITGNGVRATLKELQRIVPLEVHEIPSGRQVFDWTVPLEWNLREAFIEDRHGRRIVDTASHNLHVVSYSVPTDVTCSRTELDRHLHSLPDHPTWIPYRTSYYSRSWGFCLTHEQRTSLPDEQYRVVIDATLKDGSLTYGELYLPGSTGRDILISTHVCHPSLANDNLSGMAVAAHLAKHFLDRRLSFGLRFVFVPGTIGAIAWLAENEREVSRIRDALVISGVGDKGRFTYKKSRRGDGLLDSVFTRRFAATDNRVHPFSPYGYDERQYCSPGIDIAAGCLSRTPYGQYDEYHTSADNLDFIGADALQESLELCVAALDEAQRDVTQDTPSDRRRSARTGAQVRYINTNPKCEPQLGRRGLYESTPADSLSREIQLAQFWMLSYSDGEHSLADICDLSGIDSSTLATAAERLKSAGLLKTEKD
jgi:aminopeptidase-like protein